MTFPDTDTDAAFDTPVSHDPITVVRAHVGRQMSHADALGARADNSTPGEAALLYFPDEWQIVFDVPVAMPHEYLQAGDVAVTFNSILLTNGNVWAVTEIATYAEEDFHSGGPDRWDDYTGRQRASYAGVSASNDTVYATTPAALFTALTDEVENRAVGDNPVSWIAAARLVIDHCPPEHRADLNTSLFLNGFRHTLMDDLLPRAYEWMPTAKPPA